PAAVLLTGSRPAFHRQALWAAWRGGYPILYRADSTDHLRTADRLRGWPRDPLLRWFYGRCAALLYIGSNAQRHFRRLMGETRPLVFSPCCVDVDAFQAGELERASLRAEVRREL